MARSLPAIMSGEGGLARYMDEIRKFPMLEPQEEYMLAKRYLEHQDVDAAHRLVTSHLRLVAKIAMGYRGYGLPIGEVVSRPSRNLNQNAVSALPLMRCGGSRRRSKNISCARGVL
jgi:RNA polymerase sigma-32 factor